MVLVSYSEILLVVIVLFFPSHRNGYDIVMLKCQSSHCWFIVVAGFVL